VASRIEHYALIGDTETAALVGDDGSIDWWCVPRFDSDACFTALLGTEEHGRWMIAPAAGGRATRRQYRPNTLVLETEWETDTGTVQVIDFMPIRDETVEIVRIVRGLRGTVDMRMDLTIRFGYGKVIPWVRRVDDALVAVAGPNALSLRTPVDHRGENHATVSEFTVSEGDELPFVLRWFPSHRLPSLPRPVHAAWALARTTAWWEQWSERSTYDGEWKELVQRSLITLKALTFAPTGGIVAAPTMALPEWIGSVRNWDYRYCWLRDATFTLYSLMTAGYIDEAAAWRHWLLRAVAGEAKELQIMYGAAGERRLSEWEVDWLPGYEDSAPVRVGNAASEQFQLDVYGEVLDSLYQGREAGLVPDPDAWSFAVSILDFLRTAWKEPDEGIWEVRGPRQHFTHSKVMAWVAFDRAAKVIEEDPEASVVLKPIHDEIVAVRDEIHAEVLEKAWDATRQTFVQAYGSTKLDAAVLMMPLVGFLPATDERMVSTVEAIQRELMVDGYVQRYTTESGVDGLPPGEGAFLPCTFWLVDNLALMGRHDEARELFARLAGLANDVGLLAEEYDPEAKRQLGNFPQAFTHVSLVNSACNLSGRHGPARQRAELGARPTQ
jgi:GH15 family glucan-1,4-alpha-glucosidase